MIYCYFIKYGHPQVETRRTFAPVARPSVSSHHLPSYLHNLTTNDFAIKTLFEQPSNKPKSPQPSLLSLPAILAMAQEGTGLYDPQPESRTPVSRAEALQPQINDTIGVMAENMSKLSQRGERLDSLQDKTDNLAVSAQGFRRGANRVRKQMWWKDMKMRMCLIVGIIVLLLVIIVPAVVATHH